jgi:hypothetical protein
MKRSALIACWLCIGFLPAYGKAAELTPTTVTVLAREKTLTIERALIRGSDLLVRARDVPAINGFEVKPEGLCVGDVCIRIPTDAGWISDYKGEAYFNVTNFAEK